ncbi:hypothetical protein ACG873_31470 [Mesorhizobium sp. AaZ16]|uniref:hypothetical protein n=1 Tax=Mesorhizobium sp. AaZ16 TaxID=3402289 RepID=UPI00374E6170
MKLGFAGTGALTSAIVIGLKSLKCDPVSIVLSPRNEEIAANLASRYPNVRVASADGTAGAPVPAASGWEEEAFGAGAGP